MAQAHDRRRCAANQVAGPLVGTRSLTLPAGRFFLPLFATPSLPVDFGKIDPNSRQSGWRGTRRLSAVAR